MADVPPPTITTREIIAKLREESHSEWVLMPGYYSLSTAQIGAAGIRVDPGNSLILAAFLNTSTSEVKTYIAKFLDIQHTDRQTLFP